MAFAEAGEAGARVFRGKTWSELIYIFCRRARHVEAGTSIVIFVSSFLPFFLSSSLFFYSFLSLFLPSFPFFPPSSFPSFWNNPGRPASGSSLRPGGSRSTRSTGAAAATQVWSGRLPRACPSRSRRHPEALLASVPSRCRAYSARCSAVAPGSSISTSTSRTSRSRSTATPMATPRCRSRGPSS